MNYDQSQLFAFHGSSERSCVLITLSDYRLGKIMGCIERKLRSFRLKMLSYKLI